MGHYHATASRPRSERPWPSSVRSTATEASPSRHSTSTPRPPSAGRGPQHRVPPGHERRQRRQPSEQLDHHRRRPAPSTLSTWTRTRFSAGRPRVTSGRAELTDRGRPNGPGLCPTGSNQAGPSPRTPICCPAVAQLAEIDGDGQRPGGTNRPGNRARSWQAAVIVGRAAALVSGSSPIGVTN